MNTFVDFIYSLFGEYQPCVVVDSTSGNVVECATNWGYILAVVIFIIFLYSILKTIGGVIYEWCRK